MESLLWTVLGPILGFYQDNTIWLNIVVSRLDAGLFSKLSWQDTECKQGNKRRKAKGRRLDWGYKVKLFKNSGWRLSMEFQAYKYGKIILRA